MTRKLESLCEARDAAKLVLTCGWTPSQSTPYDRCILGLVLSNPATEFRQLAQMSVRDNELDKWLAHNLVSVYLLHLA